MLTSTLGVVLCRVGAVLLFVQSIKGLQFTLPALMDYGSFDVAAVAIFFMTLIPAIAGIGLWMFAERVCRINGRSADIEIRSNLEAIDLVSIGTLLIGLYAAFFGIVSALTTESMIWAQGAQFRNMPEMHERTSNSYLSLRVSYVSQTMLGLALILGRHRLASLLMRARYGGRGNTV